mmetsp:Transcript_107430/g.334886  ORF Transcript_107430/g.334886 Transcript_107430/m.334886 type:complete len:121 (+) Transcript_107430:48-410(+)
MPAVERPAVDGDANAHFCLGVNGEAGSAPTTSIANGGAAKEDCDLCSTSLAVCCEKGDTSIANGGAAKEDCDLCSTSLAVCCEKGDTWGCCVIGVVLWLPMTLRVGRACLAGRVDKLPSA